MNRIRKIVTLYLVAAGIAAHLAAAAVWIAKPQLVWRAQERVLGWLQGHGPGGAPAAAAADPAAVLQAALPPWQPDPQSRLGAGEIRVAGTVVSDLPSALRRLRDGDTLELGAGVYRDGLIIRPNGVTLRGDGHVVFDGAAVKGKGALLIKGNDTRVVNIECRNIQVHDRNGACVRLEGSNLTLDGVYFHSSEQGILTGPSPGRVTISNSRFALLGKHGRAHGLYIGGGELYIRDSAIVSSVSEGHEVKSRARRNVIERSVIASLGGADSRLLDISNGGELIIRDSVLQEGPATANSDVIGFALEKRQHDSHRIELTNNVILLEGPKRGNLLHQRSGTPAPTLEGNLIIGAGAADHAGLNIWLANRAEAGLPPYPALPPLPQR